MTIRRIWLKDVGPFKELEIEIPSGVRSDRADVVVITGPNGSGKTTLLYAIATALGKVDQLGRRWGETSQIALEVSIEGKSFILGVGEGYEAAINELDDLPENEGSDLEKLSWFAPAISGSEPPEGVPFFATRQSDKTISWSKGLAVEDSNRSISFLAYEAFRKLDSAPLLVIGDQQTYEPESGGRFANSIVPGSFETWIANTRTKIALAREDGDQIAVDRYDKTIRAVENAISELTGEIFTLRVSREPLEVLGVFNGSSAPLSMLPDGLRSSIAWLGDVLRRLDHMERKDGTDPLQTPIVVLLDEIDAHLHPEWQRKILYVAERLLPNAQLIVSTHSPFVVQSATDACIIKLGAHGESVEVVGPQSGSTFDAVLEDILGVRGDSFSVEIEAQLHTFKQQRNEVLQGKLAYEVLEARAKELAALSESLDLSLQRHLVDVKARMGAA
jgi:energy-coupling factor transporter ATP-binding protein EcfA2